MLTQCALEGDLPAEAITQSALIISHVKETCRTTDQFAKRLIETEVSYLNLYEE